jgi:hypothetical protein
MFGRGQRERAEHEAQRADAAEHRAAAAEARAARAEAKAADLEHKYEAPVTVRRMVIPTATETNRRRH